MSDPHLTERQKRILYALREHTSAYTMAEHLGEAPFVIRAELKALKRLQLAHLHYNHRTLDWKLTFRGEAVAYSLDQRELFT